jgi:hypothetical protein
MVLSCRGNPFFHLLSDFEQAELLASKHAFTLPKEKSMAKVVLELDCSGAVGNLTNKELDRSMHGTLVEEIKDSLKELDVVHIKHV